LTVQDVCFRMGCSQFLELQLLGAIPLWGTGRWTAHCSSESRPWQEAARDFQAHSRATSLLLWA
jgi:hypothetical protein